MRSFHEFVENRNESLLNEYIKYCLDNNLEIDEGMMDTFRGLGKKLLPAAALVTAGTMAAPHAQGANFSAKNLPANIHDIRNAPDSNPNDYKFDGQDWKIQINGKQKTFSPYALKQVMKNLERNKSVWSVHWDNESKNIKVDTKDGRILYYDINGNEINGNELSKR